MLLLCQLCVPFLGVQGSPNFPVTNVTFFAKNLPCQMAIFYNIESFPSCQLHLKSECWNHLLTYACRITFTTRVQLSCYHITLYVPVNVNYTAQFKGSCQTKIWCHVSDPIIIQPRFYMPLYKPTGENVLGSKQSFPKAATRGRS